MQMRKKSYEIISDKLCELRSEFMEDARRRDTIDIVAVNLANEFQKDNPNFRRSLFLLQCGCPKP